MPFPRQLTPLLTAALCASFLSACAAGTNSPVCDGLRGPFVALGDAAQVDAGPETMHATRRALAAFEAGCP